MSHAILPANRQGLTSFIRWHDYGDTRASTRSGQTSKSLSNSESITKTLMKYILTWRGFYVSYISQSMDQVFYFHDVFLFNLKTLSNPAAWYYLHLLMVYISALATNTYHISGASGVKFKITNGSDSKRFRDRWIWFQLASVSGRYWNLWQSNVQCIAKSGHEMTPYHNTILPFLIFVINHSNKIVLLIVRYNIYIASYSPILYT